MREFIHELVTDLDIRPMEKWLPVLMISVIVSAMAQTMNPPMQPWKAALIGLVPGLSALVVLSVLDVMSGVALSLIEGCFDNHRIYVGAIKKAIMFCIVMGTATLEMSGLAWAESNLHYVPYIPFSPTLAIVVFFCVNELGSIVRNGMLAGIPAPDWLRRTIVKRRRC